MRLAGLFHCICFMYQTVVTDQPAINKFLAQYQRDQPNITTTAQDHVDPNYLVLISTSFWTWIWTWT